MPARVGTKERETSSYLSRSAAPVSAPGFSRIVKRAAFAAKVGDQGSSALSDACSYNLANEGLDTRAVQRSWDTGTFFANFMIANSAGAVAWALFYGLGAYYLGKGVEDGTNFRPGTDRHHSGRSDFAAAAANTALPSWQHQSNRLLHVTVDNLRLHVIRFRRAYRYGKVTRRLHSCSRN